MSTTVPKAVGIKRNFGWAFIGNLLYQASQWLNLVILAKLLDVADVGRFAFALAICTPITTFASLNLRNVQVTDARDEHRFGHFLGVQLTTGLIALLIIAGIAILTADAAATAWLIIVVGLGQIVVTTRGVFLAFNQKHERMDAVAASTAFMGLASLAALSLTLWLTRNLLAGVIAMQAAKLTILIGWDLRATAKLVRLYTPEEPRKYLRARFGLKTMLSLAWIALPLGVSGLLTSINHNIPRYVIEAYLGHAQLGYFAAIMALVMAGTLVTQAAGQSALPRLSRYHQINDRAFTKLLSKMALAGGLLGIMGIIIAALLGDILLALMFTPEYANYHNIFTVSMVFGLLTYIITFTGYGITAMRFFRIQPLLYLMSAITTLLLCLWLIPQHGIIGAIFALMGGKVVQGFLSLLVICYGRNNAACPSPLASSLG